MIQKNLYLLWIVEVPTSDHGESSFIMKSGGVSYNVDKIWHVIDGDLAYIQLSPCVQH